MANDNLTLNYNIPVRVRVPGMNAAGTAERPVTGRTNGQPANLLIVAVTGQPDQYDITNTSPTATGTFTDLKFFAKNELNATINSGFVTYTLVAPDPAVNLEVHTV